MLCSAYCRTRRGHSWEKDSSVTYPHAHDARIDRPQILRSRSLRKTLETLERLIGQQSLDDVPAHQRGGEAPDQAAIGSIARATQRGFPLAITETRCQDGETSTGLYGPRHLVDTVPETTIGHATGALRSKAHGIVSLRPGEMVEDLVYRVQSPSTMMLHCLSHGEIRGTCPTYRFLSWRKSLRKEFATQLQRMCRLTRSRDFVNYIEQGFRNKGLRAQTIWLNPRITLGAIIKRQVIEGVQAVVKLTRNTQYSLRIPLQVFDRGSGASNVNFNGKRDRDHIANL
jgi:hypothetical protein